MSFISVLTSLLVNLSECIQRMFRSYGVTAYYKPSNSIRSQLVRPKDKTPPTHQCGAMYHLTCDQCDKDYVGETACLVGTRFKEHMNVKTIGNSAVKEHCISTGHTFSPSSIKILDRESNTLRRRVKEMIRIQQRGVMNCHQSTPTSCHVTRTSDHVTSSDVSTLMKDMRNVRI
jgi:hypothetical protein